MEIATIGALGLAGYYLNDNNSNKKREIEIDRNIYPGRLPNAQNIYSSNNVNEINKQIHHKQKQQFNQSKKPIQSNIIPPNFQQRILNTQNNPIKYLERPSHTRTQNQRGAEEEYSSQDDLYVNSLTGVPMKKEEFTHNNMVPFFGSQVRQNTDEYANRPILENFTGVNEHDKKKQEISPMFDPQENYGNVYGVPNMDDTVLDRYIPSRYRQNETPIEKQNVGPGLNQGYTTKPTGGFQQADTRDYVLPKTTNELRVLTNPKLTYKSRPTGPAGKIGKPGKIGEVKKYLPDTYYVNTPDRYFTTTGAVTGKTQRPKVLDKYTNRMNTSISYKGPAGPAERIKPSNRAKFRKSNKNIYTTSGYRNLTAPQEWKLNNNNQDISDYGKSGMEAYPTERETTENKTYTSNLVTMVKAIITPIQDALKTTRKENFVGSIRPTGNFQGPSKFTVYDPNDIARTTIKETNIHNERTGNIQQGGMIQSSGFVKDPEDIAKTTVKETLDQQDYDRNMNPVLPSKAPVYDPNDIARTTIKETNIHNERNGNISNTVVKEGYTTNPQYAPNTNRQFTSNHEYTGAPDGDVGRGGGDGYQTAEYTAPNTNKQFTSDHEYTGGAGSSDTVKPISYADVYNSTINEVTREKEEVSKGRAPTLSSVKVSVGEDKINVKTDKLESDIINTRELTASKIYNSIPQPETCGITTDKDTLNNEVISDRINPEILEQYKKNPYTQPLDSYAFS